MDMVGTNPWKFQDRALSLPGFCPKQKEGKAHQERCRLLTAFIILPIEDSPKQAHTLVPSKTRHSLLHGIKPGDSKETAASLESVG